MYVDAGSHGNFDAVGEAPSSHLHTGHTYLGDTGGGEAY
jgi:hypothetical protein